MLYALGSFGEHYIGYFSRRLAGVCKHFGFPNAYDFPTKLCQLRSVKFVSSNVGFDLSHPIVGVGTCLKPPLSQAPIFPVPEVAVAPNRDPIVGKHDIRFPRQLLHILMKT
jgi:hypothetical protein